MTEYFIKEHQLSAVTRTTVKDNQGRDLFLLVGHWGGKGDVLSLYKMNGDLVASIKQSSMIFGLKFDLYVRFEKVGTLKKIFNWPGDFYYIQQLHWTVFGNIYHHHYSIHHFNQMIMQMSKASLFTGDYYVLTIPNDTQAPLCICIAAIMDYWLYNRKPDRTFMRTIMPDFT